MRTHVFGKLKSFTFPCEGGHRRLVWLPPLSLLTLLLLQFQRKRPNQMQTQTLSFRLFFLSFLLVPIFLSGFGSCQSVSNRSIGYLLQLITSKPSCLEQLADNCTDVSSGIRAGAPEDRSRSSNIGSPIAVVPPSPFI